MECTWRMQPPKRVGGAASIIRGGGIPIDSFAFAAGGAKVFGPARLALRKVSLELHLATISLAAIAGADSRRRLCCTAAPEEDRGPVCRSGDRQAGHWPGASHAATSAARAISPRTDCRDLRHRTAKRTRDAALRGSYDRTGDRRVAVHARLRHPAKPHRRGAGGGARFRAAGAWRRESGHRHLCRNGTIGATAYARPRRTGGRHRPLSVAAAHRHWQRDHRVAGHDLSRRGHQSRECRVR